MSYDDQALGRALLAAWDLGGLDGLSSLVEEMQLDDEARDFANGLVMLLGQDVALRRSRLNDHLQAVIARTMNELAFPGMTANHQKSVRMAAYQAAERTFASLGILACDAVVDPSTLALRFDDARLHAALDAIRRRAETHPRLPAEKTK